MSHYRIQHQTIADLADQIRVLVGTAQLMTPAEMLAWLQTVKCLALGKANCAAAVAPVFLSASAVGVVYKKDSGHAATVIAPARPDITSTLTKES